ncbi:hypothetical protein L484_023689 [Morus notabilis]|uniref:Uncharacterized protein n=1 Tax=Morus notabilis TaxID=981085 RepID=W9RDW5_9ROSA|nr:hypothetical protein L484_023689 [Morus notabilis]
MEERKQKRRARNPDEGEEPRVGQTVEEDDADETDCGRVKNRSLSESVSEDAWPIREYDGEARDSELDAPHVPSPKGIIIWVKSSPMSNARKAKPTVRASPAEQQQPNPLRAKDRARPPRENPTFSIKA